MEKKIWQSNLTKNPKDADDYYIKRVDAIIENAVYRRASDIHLEPFSVDRMRIRYRIDGKLCVVKEEPYQFFDRLITRIKILSKLNITESRLPQDGAFQHCFGEKRID
ncbi:ATPase, T2SS/T4P/T4SS family, partial [Eubacterium aggregans]|uniref:ATPase, T2SS/T4P/T4SS family n=1 Tax=Eubacterium aggregans TaxID=81409 RepID=UPI0023F3E2E4